MKLFLFFIAIFFAFNTSAQNNTKQNNANILKKEACEKMGLKFEFMIIDHKVYNKWSKLVGPLTGSKN